MPALPRDSTVVASGEVKDRHVRIVVVPSPHGDYEVWVGNDGPDNTAVGNFGTWAAAVRKGLLLGEVLGFDPLVTLSD